MTKKLKQITKFMALCSLIILGGCTQEKDFVNEHNHSNIDFKEKSFKEALSLPLFNDAMQKVAKQRGTFRSENAAKTALEDQYGFSIVTDAPVRIITNENGTVFYTILIEREVKEELIFENLMMKVEDEETTAAVFKYTLTEKGEISENGDYPIKGISTTVYTDLNVEGRMFFNADGETCFDWYVFKCDAGLGYTHTAFATCFDDHTAYPVVSIVCMGDNPNPNQNPTGDGSGGGSIGGSGNNNTGSSNNTGGLGSSGGDPDPVLFSPISCKTGNCMEEDIVTPCEDLANHVDPTKGNIKPGVDWLKNILGNPLLNLLEFGTNYKKLADVNTGGYNYVNTNVSSGNNDAVTLNVSCAGIGGAHNHPITGDSMFSFGDLDLLLDMYDTACGSSRKEEVVLILVCRHPNPALAALGVTFTYAVKVNDIEKLRAAITAKKNSGDYAMYEEKDRNKAINKELATWYSKSPNKEKTFLQFFGNYGVDVYKANENLTSWNKLQLQPNSTGILTVNQIPCI